MIQSENVSLLQQRYGLKYHIPFLLQAQHSVGLAGKKVIEVGGSLPEALVLGEVGATSWIAVEETTYWSEIGETKSWAKPKNLSEAGQDDLLLPYQILTGAIEDAPAVFDGAFDLAFSIAAFEHINNLPAALTAIHRVLRPGGILFSMFSPVWSAPDGHHLPELCDAAGRPITPDTIPPWGHLLMRPPELHRRLRHSLDPATAAEIVRYIYHSPHINRLFAEDYIGYIQQTPFEVIQLSVTFPRDIPPGIQTELERLHPGRSLFSTEGMLMILKKSI